MSDMWTWDFSAYTEADVDADAPSEAAVGKT